MCIRDSDDCDTLTKIITKLQNLTPNDYITPELMTIISNFLENKEEYKQVEIKKFEPKYKEYTYQIVVLEKIK